MSLCIIKVNLSSKNSNWLKILTVVYFEGSLLAVYKIFDTNFALIPVLVKLSNFSASIFLSSQPRQSLHDNFPVYQNCYKPSPYLDTEYWGVPCILTWQSRLTWRSSSDSRCLHCHPPWCPARSPSPLSRSCSWRHNTAHTRSGCTHDSPPGNTRILE